MTVSNNSQYRALHLSMKLNPGNMQCIQHVNIPTHPILDESDMCVDHQTSLRDLKRASLSSHVFQPMHVKQSELRCRPKCCDNQSESFPTIIVFMIDHRCHGRVLDHCCTSLLSTTMCLCQFKFSLCGILHARFLWLHLKWAFFRANAQVLFLLPGSSAPADLSSWAVPLRVTGGEQRRRRSKRRRPLMSLRAWLCLYCFIILDDDQSASLHAAGRDIRCPGGAVWWAGQAGRVCREVKCFFFLFYIPM